MLSSGRSQRASASMGSVICAGTVSSRAAADGCLPQPSCLHLRRSFPCSQYAPPPQPSLHQARCFPCRFPCSQYEPPPQPSLHRLRRFPCRQYEPPPQPSLHWLRDFPCSQIEPPPQPSTGWLNSSPTRRNHACPLAAGSTPRCKACPVLDSFQETLKPSVH